MVKFLLTVLIVSFIIRFLAPVLLRLFVSSFLKKQARRYAQPFEGNPFQAPPPEPRPNGNAQPGQVRVDFVPPAAKPETPKNFQGGEYVDYEEVK
jgi:hypothetical protein